MQDESPELHGRSAADEESQNATVLVVDDDLRLVSLVRIYLEREGFRVVAAYDGEQALALAARLRPRFVILDLMLPKMDGLTVCRRLRKISDVPILMLTAKVEEADKVAGLRIGADDYVTKPFSPRELVERVRTILRRAGAGRPAPQLVHAGLVMHLDRHEVTLDGREVQFTAFEYTLLQTLMEFPGRVFTREQLLAHLYAFDETIVGDRTIDVHIGKIREKLGDDPAQPRYVHTIRGVGYKLRVGDRAG
jgi:DNA-binding response OmpR family regulator